MFSRDQRTCDYLDCISSAGALQFVDSPTRHSAYYSSCSLIDNVYFSFDCGKLNVNVVDYDISDYMPVIYEIKLNLRVFVLRYFLSSKILFFEIQTNLLQTFFLMYIRNFSA